MNKKGLYWICQIGGWLFFVLLNSLLAKLSNVFDSNVAKSMAVLFVTGILISHLYRHIIVRNGWLKLSTIHLIPLVIFTTIVFAILTQAVLFFVEWVIGIADIDRYNTNSILYNIFQIALLFFFWSLIYFLFHYIENYKKAEIANLKWEASINEIELNKLKSQLNPHFIFNAMNSIRALVDEHPDKSKDAITQLSNILRTTLQMGKNKVIDFDEELKVVSDYLALESTRYEERLNTSLQIHPLSKNFQVPPLMIQTLVENGIKHGISKLTRGGILELITQVENNTLIIHIKNSGQLKDITESESGYGIKNTLQRLQLLYGKAASLKISNQDSTTVLTELIIPKNVII